MCGWEWVVVGVDGWLLMMWVGLVVVGVVAAARGGSRGLMVGVGSVVGVVGGPWGWMGVFHISQWSACHSGWDSVLGTAMSVSSGSGGIMRHLCSRGANRRGGQVGSV